MKIEEHISLQGHKGQVWSVAWNPKPCNHARHMLASSGDDAKTIVWHNIDSKWEEFQVLADEEKRSMRSCAWHPEGTTLAAGGCGTKISLWRYDQGTKEFSLLGNIHHFYGEKVKNLSWNMDGSLLLYCSNRGHISIAKESNNDGYVNVCRVKLEENVPLSCARWYPSGDKFVVAGSRDIKTFELDKNDQGVLEACASHANYTIIHTYHEGAINDVSFLSDQRMVSAGADKKLNFWWLDSSKFVLGSDRSKQKRYSWSFSTSSNEHKREILCTDWSRCAGAFGYLVASACEERTILLHMAGDKWNVSNPKTCTLVASKYDAHKGSIKDLKWHCEDPNKLASVGSDGLVKIWEVSQYTTQE